jgi:DEAD/DEAH box helicase domain-containing protein
MVKMRSGLAGLGYSLSQLAPLFIMCDTNDLGSHVDAQSPLSDGQPSVVIYDQVPAGIGLCDELYKIHDQLIQSALDLVTGCDCQDGCPACVGAAGEMGSGGKSETIALLQLLNGKPVLL